MPILGWPELTLLLGILILLHAPVWPAMRAKPLGPLPYRWGCYVGIQSFLASAVLLVEAYSFAGNHPLLAAASALQAVLLASAGIGLLRRRRWGVACLFAGYLTREAVPAMAGSGSAFIGLIATLIFLGINLLYFGKRWTWMGLKAS